MATIKFNPGAQRAYQSIPEPVDIPLSMDVWLQSNGITAECPAHAGQHLLVLRNHNGAIDSALHLEREPDSVWTADGSNQLIDNPRAGMWCLRPCLDALTARDPFPWGSQAPWTTNVGELSPQIEWPRIGRMPEPPEQTDAEAEALELAGFCSRCGEQAHEGACA